MNQDNYLCEALKMRNLVSEFNPPHYANNAEVRWEGRGGFSSSVWGRGWHAGDCRSPRCAGGRGG